MTGNDSCESCATSLIACRCLHWSRTRRTLSRGGTAKACRKTATRERLSYVPADDDLTHTVIAQIALQMAPTPTEFRTLHLARTWFRYMPYAVTVGGASMLALRNLVIPLVDFTSPEIVVSWAHLK